MILRKSRFASREIHLIHRRTSIHITSLAHRAHFDLDLGAWVIVVVERERTHVPKSVR